MKAGNKTLIRLDLILLKISLNLFFGRKKSLPQ